MYDRPLTGEPRTCSCMPKDYKPSFIYGQNNARIFFCKTCGRYLSIFQTDCYDGSNEFNLRIAEIEEARERKMKRTQSGTADIRTKHWGEDIYDQVI